MSWPTLGAWHAYVDLLGTKGERVGGGMTVIGSALLGGGVRWGDLMPELVPALSFASVMPKISAPLVDAVSGLVDVSRLIPKDVVEGSSQVLGLLRAPSGPTGGFGSFLTKGASDAVIGSVLGGVLKEQRGGLAGALLGPVTSDLISLLPKPTLGFKAPNTGYAGSFLKNSESDLMSSVYGVERLGFRAGTGSSVAASMLGLQTGPRSVGQRFSGFRTGPSRPAVDRSVGAWLHQVRADLRQRHEAMWDAVDNSLDPVLHAATSGVELLEHLFNARGASREDVLSWALAKPRYAREALAPQPSGMPRVTWAGRARLAALLADYDEVGQDLLVSLVESAARLQRIKHNSHRYATEDLQPRLEDVDSILALLAWRL